MTLTPEQFDKLATKVEFNELKNKVDTLDKKVDTLDKKVERVVVDLVATKDGLHKMKQDIIEELGGKFDQILTAVDGIAKKHETFEQELAANIGAHDWFQADITKLKVHTGLQA